MLRLYLDMVGSGSAHFSPPDKFCVRTWQTGFRFEFLNVHDYIKFIKRISLKHYKCNTTHSPYRVLTEKPQQKTQSRKEDLGLDGS